MQDFINKFKNEKYFKELRYLKEIHRDVMVEACKLRKKDLDPEGNRYDVWGIGENKVNKPYDPPLGWIGIGLKVKDKYDDGDNTWIGMNNKEGEWCVAYHGVGRNENDSNEVKKITSLIIKGDGKEDGKLKKGINQEHQYHKDKFHNGQFVGEGAYCTPKISIAESYAGISQINGINYKTVLMVRVNPNSIRSCGECEFAEDYWVVDGTRDEIRPYRILYKKC